MLIRPHFIDGTSPDPESIPASHWRLTHSGDFQYTDAVRPAYPSASADTPREGYQERCEPNGFVSCEAMVSRKKLYNSLVATLLQLDGGVTVDLRRQTVSGRLAQAHQLPHDFYAGSSVKTREALIGAMSVNRTLVRNDGFLTIRAENPDSGSSVALTSDKTLVLCAENKKALWKLQAPLRARGIHPDPTGFHTAQVNHFNISHTNHNQNFANMLVYLGIKRG